MKWVQKRKTQLTNVAFLIGALMMAPATSAETTASDPKSGQWRVAGQDLSNSRNQPAEHLIGAGNVKALSPQWTFTTGGDVSATPTADGNAVYFPDWAGNLFAVEKKSGRLIWSHKIAEYNGVAGSVSRVSPALDGDQVIIGDIISSNQVHNGANVISVHRKNGKLQWITQVDSHPAAVITGSPVVFKGVVYVGVSSIEETLAIDPKRGSLFLGTGNNYTAPADVEACQNADPSANCAAADDFFDAALALDLKTGAIKWSKRLQGFDVWTVACLRPTGPKANCPVPGSPDFDFGGSGPNLVGNIVGIGQKSGIYWALDPDDGRIVWTAAVGPGGSLGGIEWGTATDGERIYVAIGNNDHLPYTLVPSGQKITWGSWSALDVKTGNILWQTADPTAGTMDTGAVSVANGVLYAGSYAGQMYALDAKTGEILWAFPSGGSVIDAPSILDGFVYWGSGYRNIPPGIGNNKVFAFTAGTGEKDKESNGKGGK